MTAIQFTSGSSKASIWQQHLIQLQSSGWTQKAYCRENNLSHRQFWQRIPLWTMTCYDLGNIKYIRSISHD
jgi:hypothetical protein